jgi:hypothetical protein
MLTTVATAATPTSTPVVAPLPSVEKLTIAVESWGSDEINPAQMKTVNFLINDHLPILATRDEHYNVVPALATKWEGSPQGWTFTLDFTAKVDVGPEPVSPLTSHRW